MALKVICKSCNGKGKIPGRLLMKTCPSCKGKGRIKSRPSLKSIFRIG